MIHLENRWTDLKISILYKRLIPTLCGIITLHVANCRLKQVILSYTCNNCFCISDYSIEMMRGSGILKKLVTYTNTADRVEDVRDTNVSFEDILPILVIIVIGVSASIIFLLVEMLAFLLRQYFSRQTFNCIIPFPG
jgi:small-conductance mechanosensitive channel